MLENSGISHFWKLCIQFIYIQKMLRRCLFSETHTTMKNIIAIIAICLSTAIVSAADSPAPSTFQLRPVVEAPSADSEQMTITSTLPNGEVRKQALNVEKTVLLDATALKSATTGKDQLGNTHISVTLNDEGKKKFAEV